MAYGILDIGQKQLADANYLMSQSARMELERNRLQDQLDNAEEAEDRQTMGTMTGMGLQAGLSETGRELVGQGIHSAKEALGIGAEAANTANAVNTGVTTGAMTTGMQTGIGTAGAVSSGVTTGAMTTGMQTGAGIAATGAAAGTSGATAGAASGMVAGPVGALAGLAAGYLFSRLF